MDTNRPSKVLLVISTIVLAICFCVSIYFWVESLYRMTHAGQPLTLCTVFADLERGGLRMPKAPVCENN